MTGRSRNIKSIFVGLRFGASVVASGVRAPMQGCFGGVLCESLTFWIPPLWFLEYSEKRGENRNKPL